MEYMEGPITATIVLIVAFVNDQLVGVGNMNSSKQQAKNHAVKVQSAESNTMVRHCLGHHCSEL